MSSPLILIKTFELLESVIICLFPVALVTSITLTGVLLYLGAFTFGLLLILKRKENFVLVNRDIEWHVSTFLIYIFAFTLTKLINSGMESSMHTFFRTCQDYFIFLWVIFFVFKNNRNHRLLKFFLVISGIISIFYGLLQFFGFDFFHRQVIPGRLSGFHKNPYSYSGQLIVFFFLLLNQLLFLIPSKEILRYGGFSFGLVTCFFCILNASERAVIFGVLVALVIYVILQKLKGDNLLALSAIVFMPFFLTMLFNKKLVKRIKRVVAPQKNSKLNIRFKLWGIAIAIWKRNFLFGTGNFPPVYCQIDSAFPFKVLTHAHNVYLHVLVTNGIIGLFALLNLFFSLLKWLFNDLKSNRYASCLIAIICAYLVEGFFEYFWGDTEVRYLFLYFVGFVAGHRSVKS